MIFTKDKNSRIGFYWTSHHVLFLLLVNSSCPFEQGRLSYLMRTWTIRASLISCITTSKLYLALLGMEDVSSQLWYQSPSLFSRCSYCLYCYLYVYSIWKLATCIYVYIYFYLVLEKILLGACDMCGIKIIYIEGRGQTFFFYFK